MSPRTESTGQSEKSCSSKSRAKQLCIPDHALSALEYQARRHYRRWWLDEAERIARKVIRFDLGRAGAWFVLGDIEMRRMNWQRAFGHFQQAVDCHVTDALAWCRGAEALFRLGEVERAAEWLEHAVSIAPPGGSPGSRRARQFLARHKDEFDRARRSNAQADSGRADSVKTQPDQNEATMKLQAFQGNRLAKKGRRRKVRRLRDRRQD